MLTHAKPQKRDWGYYVQVLKENNANPKLVSIVDDMRRLDRNPLVHPEDWLGMDEAIAIFNTTQTAFDRIISDMENSNLLPPNEEEN
jgi:hypothetical protein